MRVAPLGSGEIEAVRAFNERMAAANAPGDFLSDRVAAAAVAGSISSIQHVVIDGSAVRGGVLRIDYPGWLNQAEITAINYQSPISEGIIDKRYGMVAMLLVKYMQQQGPHLFVVGMGNQKNPLPRLLKASGWSVRPVPFFFRVGRPNRFLCELRLLTSDPRLAAVARAAAWTGAGWLGIKLLHLRGILARRSAARYVIEPVDEWGPWADELWRGFRPGCSFSVGRDRRTLAALYPKSDGRIRRFVIRRNAHVAGWTACFNSQMHEHSHFGNMRVGTILDCVAEPEAAPAAIALTAHTLEEEGADLVISNQTHRLFTGAFRRCGFLAAASNYLLAMSPQLSAGIEATQIHVTRGDGDGRIHL